MKKEENMKKKIVHIILTAMVLTSSGSLTSGQLNWWNTKSHEQMLKDADDRLLAKLKEDIKSAPTARSQRDFEYLNYLDTSADLIADDANTGRLAQKTERIDRAKKERNERNKIDKVSISEIKIEEVKLALDQDGYPTTEALKQLLHNEYFLEIPTNELTIKSVPIGRSKSSKKIYCASIKNKPIFFLKISKDIESHIRLASIQQGSIGRLRIKARYTDENILIHNKNLPILTWIEKLFVYTNPQEKKQTIEMAHAAKGKSVNEILETESLPSKIKCVKAVGKALGFFQQAFMNYTNLPGPDESPTDCSWLTICHGDLHSNNVFFDDINSQVYFIDNESMENQCSMDKAFYDVYKFISLSSLFATHDYPAILISYLKAYIESFPIEKRAFLAESLRDNYQYSFLGNFLTQNLKIKEQVDSLIDSYKKHK
jgi:hypothetical protein